LGIAALRFRIRQVFRMGVEGSSSLVLKHTRPQVLQGVLFAPARRKEPLPKRPAGLNAPHPPDAPPVRPMGFAIAPAAAHNSR
jgi:hypothetical protein